MKFAQCATSSALFCKNYGNPDTRLYGEALKYKRSTSVLEEGAIAQIWLLPTHKISCLHSASQAKPMSTDSNEMLIAHAMRMATNKSMRNLHLVEPAMTMIKCQWQKKVESQAFWHCWLVVGLAAVATAVASGQCPLKLHPKINPALLTQQYHFTTTTFMLCTSYKH